MSDTMSDIDDVEDVLSSIRRLVSETTVPPTDKLNADSANTAKPQNGVDANALEAINVDAPKPAPPEALILTSAQRVDHVADVAQDGVAQDGVAQDIAPEIAAPDLSSASHPTMADTMRKAVEGAFEEEQRQFLAEESAVHMDGPDLQDQHSESPETRHESLAGAWPNRPPEDYYEDEADKEQAEPLHADTAASEEWGAREDDANPVEDPQETSASDDAQADMVDGEEADDDEGEAAVWIDPAFDDDALQFERQGTAEIHHFDPTMTVVEAGWTDDGEIIDASEIEAVDEDEAEEEGPSHEDEIVDAFAEVEDAIVEDAVVEDAIVEDAIVEDAMTQVEAEEEGDDTDMDAPPGIAAFLRGNPEDAVRENGRASMFSSDYDASTPAEDDADSGVDLGNLDETTLLDEEALRDMVAEIVREELTGDMGERITRNVRKLVRREIHRALMTREFD